MKKPIDGVSPEAMAALMAHDWPGNVRELRNVLERGAVVATGERDPARRPRAPARGSRRRRSPARSASLEEVEKRHVAAVLAHTGGNVSQSARILGIDRVTLYNKMKKWGLRRDGEEAETVARRRAEREGVSSAASRAWRPPDGRRAIAATRRSRRRAARRSPIAVRAKRRAAPRAPRSARVIAALAAAHRRASPRVRWR